MGINGQLKRLMDQIPDHLWITDLDFNVVYINNSIESYGWLKEDLIGKNISYFSPPETVEVCYAARDRYMEDPENNYTQKLIVECHYKDSDETYTIEINVTVFKDNDKVVGFCGVSRDITEDLLINKMKEENIKLKSFFEVCGGICHEMSQPLQTISGSATLLKMVNKNADLDSTINSLMKQSDRVNALIHSLQTAKKFSTKSYLGGKILDVENI